MTPFIVLAAWLALNVLATRHILLLGDRARMPRMRIAWVWLAPFVGAVLSLLETMAAQRQLRAERVAPPVRVREPASGEVTAAGARPFPLREHLHLSNGFPLVDWRAAEFWLGTIADADACDAARVDLHRAWLAHLRDSLHDGFWVHESEDVLILSSLETAVANATGRYVTMARKRVAQTLGALARFPAGLKSVVLVVDDDEAYYRYISICYPAEGEFALSGGVFLDAGCPHFVVRRDDLSAVEPTIAHELTHAALAHLRLPRWLDEGLAVNTEHRIAGAHRGLHTPRQLHEKHRAFWHDESIQQFWSGRSFFRTDDGNLLSYDLARIMVAQMGRNWAAFEQFARHARRGDAGAAAAREHMGLDLGAYASLIVEREPSEAWTPAAGTSDTEAEAEAEAAGDGPGP